MRDRDKLEDYCIFKNLHVKIYKLKLSDMIKKQRPQNFSKYIRIQETFHETTEILTSAMANIKTQHSI